MEATLVTGQTASQNRIAQLEKQVATTTAELQKLRHLLHISVATSSHNPTNKGSQQPGPTTPPYSQKILAPTNDPSPPDWPWKQMPDNLSWADRVCQGSGLLTVDETFTTVEQKKKKKAPDMIIPKPHPYAKRQVIIMLNTSKTNATTTVDQTLQAINKTIKDIPDITQPPFILAYITGNNYLVLTTNPTTKVSVYKLYLQMIANIASNLNTVETIINECWSEFLLHNIPTNTDLNVIYSEIKTTYPSLYLGQTPHWLVPAERWTNKTASTWSSAW
jgi:hypothetical protein